MRSPRPAAPAVLALCCLVPCLFGLVGRAAPAGAAPAAATTTTLSLLDQSPWVEPSDSGPGTFDLSLSAVGPEAVGADVSVTVYNRLRSRSTFQGTLSWTPAELASQVKVLDAAQTVPLSSLASDGPDRYGLPITVVPSASTAANGSGALVADLQCSSVSATCDGVYPVEVSLVRPSGGATLDHFTTYLTYTGGTSPERLRFAWVVPVSTPVVIHPGTHAPGDAVAGPTRSQVQALSSLVDSVQHAPSVPVTIAALPQTVAGLAASGATGRQAVAQLSDMSNGSGSRQFLPETYVSVDAGAMAAAGLTGELTAQIDKGSGVLRTARITVPVADEGPSTWVATGTVGTALGAGLSYVGALTAPGATTTGGASHLVLPDTSLAPSSSGSGTWSSPFQLTLGHTTVTAAASDGELAAHFTAKPHDPALAANQLLADLALIHFEAPNADDARGVVAVPPTGWVPSAAFDNELLDGLEDNPVVQPVTLDGLFTSVAVGANGAATERKLASSGTGPVVPRPLARQIASARLRTTSFDSAVQGAPDLLSQLDSLLLASESNTLSSAGQTRGVQAFERSLGGQLDQIRLATEGAITFTSNSASIPITIVSSAPYTVRGVLTLASAKFTFPQNHNRQTVSRAMIIDRNTNPVRIPAHARTPGDLPVDVVLHAPEGTLVITHGQLTVHSTTASIAGVVLTLIALAVLLAWWARTWRRGRAQRRAG